MATTHTIRSAMDYIVFDMSFSDLKNRKEEIIERTANCGWSRTEHFSVTDSIMLLSMVYSDTSEINELRTSIADLTRSEREMLPPWISARLGDTRIEDNIISNFHNAEKHGVALYYAKLLSLINSTKSITALCYGFESNLTTRNYDFPYVISLRSELLRIVERNLIELPEYKELLETLDFPLCNDERTSESFITYQNWINDHLSCSLDIPADQRFMLKDTSDTQWLCKDGSRDDDAMVNFLFDKYGVVR